ncbi:MAG: TraR/DksA C4-type zinc finger protein [Chloroflexota bacterium]|nr:TraR/DksA C4-type zinc finger protein [Chloroflexota bacterium]
MATRNLESAKSSLESRRTELVEDLERMSDEIQSLGVEQEKERGGLGNHFADDGSSVMEVERLSTMRADLSDLLSQIDAALQRMETGEFGICQRCHQSIGAERLEAFPYVAYCINCQTILEREQALLSGG